MGAAMGAPLVYCPRCWSPQPAAARVCSRCGAPLPVTPFPPPPPPASSGTPLVAAPAYPPPYAYSPALPYGGYSPPPPAPRARTAVAIVLSVVVLLAVLIGVAVYYAAHGVVHGVAVSQLQVHSNDNACGLSGAVFPGFSSIGGGSVYESLSVGPAGSSGCSILAVSALTPGFTVARASTPLNLSAGTTGILNFWITAPSSGYTGSVAIEID